MQNKFMKKRIESMLDEYYTALGLERDNSRHREQVQARAAMMVALKKYMTASASGRVFGLDHATALHHGKKHEANMKYWDGYAHKFKLARRMCHFGLGFKTLNAKLDAVREEIEKLRTLERKLIQNLKDYEQLQIQDDEHKGQAVC
jgi:hypothetical protein